MKLIFLLVFGVAIFTLLMIGCINDPNTSPTTTSTSNGIVGVWEGQFAKTGTMCVTDRDGHCLRTIPWLRKDINRIDFKPDSSATREFDHIRVNENDSSDSYKELDSMSYSVTADSIIFQIKKSKFGRDTVWVSSLKKIAYKINFSQSSFTFDNYNMVDTGIVYLTNLNFVKVQ